MKKLIWIVLLIIIAAAVYTNWPLVQNTAYAYLYVSPCDKPLTYKIGNVDYRFNLSDADFAAAINEAGQIWSNEQGKQLFAYNPDGPMVIDMVYDERQLLNTKINSMDTNLKQQDQQLKPEISQYNQQVITFKQKSAALNAEIDSWNTKGGAPEDVYKDLQSRQQSLQEEATQLEADAEKLGQSTDDYNTQVQQLNKTVTVYNQALKYKPEEGLFTQDVNGNRKIDIYFNNAHTELVHTLAHEMGHALGLSHNPDTQSIMYAQTNNVVTPSVEDRDDLDTICEKKSVFLVARDRIQNNLAHLQLPAFIRQYLPSSQ